MNTLQQLFNEERQSPWIDFIDRQLIESGRLDALIRDGLRGLTSNPTIFASATLDSRPSRWSSARILRSIASSFLIAAPLIRRPRRGTTVTHCRRTPWY